MLTPGAEAASPGRPAHVLDRRAPDAQSAARPRVSRPGQLALVAGVLASVTAVFFFPLLRGETFADVANRQATLYPWAMSGIARPPAIHFDQTDTFYPWQVFINAALRSGELPLWNPYSFAGEPFLANGQNGVLYPPRSLLSLIVAPERAHDLLLVSHMLLGGLTMFLLLGSVRLTVPAALFGAVAWMANSFMLTWMALEHYVVIEAWLPLAVLLLRRALIGHAWGAGVGLAVILALIFLGGNLLFVEITFAALAAYAGCVLLGRWRRLARGRPIGAVARPVGRDALLAAAPFILMAGLIAVQLLPSLDLVRSMGRVPLPYDQFVTFRVQPGDLLYLFLELPRWDAQEVTDPYHRLLFVGTPTAYLALVGIFARHSLARYASWLAATVLLVVLGTPVAWLAYTLLPGFGAFKPLGRALFLFDFAIAILAAFGLDLILGAGLRGKLWNSPRVPWRHGIGLALTLLVVVQMHHFGESVIRYSPDTRDNLYPETPLLEALGRSDATRILPIDPFFFGSIPMAFHLQNAGGYDSLLPDRTTNFWRVVQGADPEEVFREARIGAYQIRFQAESARLDLLPRLSVTDVLAPPPAFYTGRSPAEEQPDLAFARASDLDLVYSGPDGRIYRVENPLPRAYLVPACERVATPPEALRRFADPSFDPWRGVLIDAQALADTGARCEEAGPPGQPPGSAVIAQRSVNTLSVALDAPRAGWLVVNESWEAGWRATVDGRPVPVLPGNYAFRAVPVPAGQHTVEFAYQPEGFWRGLGVSVGTAGLLGALGVLWAIRRWRPRSRATLARVRPRGAPGHAR